MSSDSHAGLPTEDYRGYSLASKYHPQFEEFLAERAAQLEAITRLGVRNEDYAKKWFEEHEEALRSGWEAGKRDEDSTATVWPARSCSPMPTPSRAAPACRSAPDSA